MNEELYKVRSNLNNPTRILSLTIDELLIIASGVMIFFFCDTFVAKGVVIAIGSSLVSLLRYAKKGRGPKVLLVYCYWLLPSKITQFFMSKMPASHKRIWKA